MAGNLAYYPLSRKTADPIGSLAPQSLQVINCRFDATQAFVNHSPGQNSKTPYSNTGTDVDYGIREGELVFTFRNQLGFDHPHVRACLNNISIEALTDGAALTKLRESIVIIGVSTKTCSVNSININHTEAPVAAIAGHLTVLNVSMYTTIPGDVLIWCLPHPGVNRGTQAPVDGSSAMSPLRRVLEPVPLRVLMEPFSTRNAGNVLTRQQRENSAKLFTDNDMLEFGLQHAFKNFLLHVMMHHGMFEAGGAGIATKARNADENGHMYDNQAGYDAMLGDIKQQVDGFMGIMVHENNGVKKPSAVLDDIVCSLLPLVGAINQMVTSRRVAHVTRGAVPGKRHDVSIQLGPSSATKRMHGGF